MYLARPQRNTGWICFKDEPGDSRSHRKYFGNKAQMHYTAMMCGLAYHEGHINQMVPSFGLITTERRPDSKARPLFRQRIDHFSAEATGYGLPKCVGL